MSDTRRNNRINRRFRKWHMERQAKIMQPPTPKCACGLSADVCGEAYVQPTLPEEVEAAVEATAFLVAGAKSGAYDPDANKHGDAILDTLATLRAHIEAQDATIEALTVERDEAIAEVGHKSDIGHAMVAAWRDRAEAAEQRVAVLEAVQEAATEYRDSYTEGGKVMATTSPKIHGGDGSWEEADQRIRRAQVAMYAALAAAEES